MLGKIGAGFGEGKAHVQLGISLNGAVGKDHVSRFHCIQSLEILVFVVT